MAKYLLLWEVDTTHTPTGKEERKKMHLGMQSIVTQQVKAGQITQWGAFVGEAKGYCIIDGAAEDVHTLTGGWIPFVRFQTNEVLSIEQVMKATEAI